MFNKKEPKKMARKTKQSMASRSVKKKPATIGPVFKWSVVGALLMCVTVVGGWFIWQQQISINQIQQTEQMMPIRLVEIQGELNHIDKERILTVLRSLSRESDTDQQTLNFLTADLRELEKELESVPWIYRVKVRRIWPDKLTIDLEEQQAVAVWNKDQLVNRFGHVFEPSVIDLDHLPILTGPDDELTTLLTTFAELQSAFEQAELQLKELHMSERRSYELKLTNGIVVDVGRKDLHVRVKRFIDTYPAIVSDNPAAIERVDLRYDTGLAVSRINAETRQASLY